MSPASDIHRILVLRTDRLGETLLTLPAVAALRTVMPGSSVTLLVHPELASLLAGSPGVEDVLPYDRAAHPAWGVRAWRLGRSLRERRFDLAIVSNPMKELHLAVWVAGITRRVGYDRKWSWCLTRRIPDRKALGERHELEYTMDLVKAAVDEPLPPLVPRWPLPTFDREHGEVLQRLEEQGIQRSEPFVAVHPWTSNPQKQWPSLRYQTVIRVLAQQLPVAVVGGAEARQAVRHLLPAPLPRVADLVGHLTLRQLAAILQRARLLLSNDSGPVHLAAAMGTPTVVLFGTPDAATGPKRWGPWGSIHTVIWKPSMDAISVDEVIAAVEAAVAHRAP